MLVLPPPACPFRCWLWQGYLLPLGPTTELASAKLRFQERAFSQIGKVFPDTHLSEGSLRDDSISWVISAWVRYKKAECYSSGL